MYCLFHSIQVSNIRVNSNAILVLKFINHGISEFSFPIKSRSIFLWFPECCANSFLYMSYTFFLDNLNSICRINIVDLIVTFAVTSEYKSVYWSLRVTTDCLKYDLHPLIPRLDQYKLTWWSWNHSVSNILSSARYHYIKRHNYLMSKNIIIFYLSEPNTKMDSNSGIVFIMIKKFSGF